MSKKASYAKTLGKIIVFCIFSISSIYFVNVIWENSASGLKIVKIYGLLPMWAVFAGVFVFPVITIWVIQEDIKVNILKVNPNKLLAILGLGLAPLLAFGFHSKTVSNINGYVECKSMRDVALRYSSRTYSISPELCEQQ